MALKMLKGKVSNTVVLIHARLAKVKTDKGSVTEYAGLIIVGLVVVGVILFGYRGIIITDVLPALKTNITNLFSNVPTS
ncbi:hypothetical protein [Acetobacterium bakii]|uniref:Uncharacterized protein n=1 Tax=Acetobacterium bakii TaxID=52689 RepID=A0A0L6U249_9FIRM|nr:hypothetical protein [Acetobacterium bakii]KNZ42407.1 hypothetical protein AKG39_06450 [Acetobacterium bakii]